MKDSSNVLISMRLMAWERAKGELNSLLHTYWEDESGNKSNFKPRKELIENFIKDFEK